uniref:Uncharacterized protein n=1 Tax=Knipowitschia caucasica TaxID=637954 RepID=A0AAV2L5Q7_KNICA
MNLLPLTPLGCPQTIPNTYQKILSLYLKKMKLMVLWKKSPVARSRLPFSHALRNCRVCQSLHAELACDGELESTGTEPLILDPEGVPPPPLVLGW